MPVVAERAKRATRPRFKVLLNLVRRTSVIVKESTLDVPTPTGPMRTYIYTPVPYAKREAKYPGLVLYSEIFQQTEPIKRLAITFASTGLVVMVPEVYHSQLPPGTVLGYDDAGKNKGNELKSTIPLAVFDQDTKAALDALEKHPQCDGKLGALGFCLGGHLSFRAALDPRVLGTACFFGTDLHSCTLGKEKKADSLARAGEIKGELLMIWGRQDPHIPFEGRRQIYDALHHAGVTYTWHEFNAAHAFMRDEGDRWDPAVGQLCRSLAFDHFQRTLR
jgi:carboxymethylenebutenolidase